MTSPDRKSASEIKIGEMPTPRYLLRAGDTTGDGSIRWIGMEAFSADKEVKPFLWWRNFQVGDLSSELPRYHTAAFIVRLKLEMGVDAAIGFPVDLSKSNSALGHVAIEEEQGLYGVYIEADKRPMFNFMTAMHGIKSEEELRQENPVEFEKAFQKAKEVLPYPKAASAESKKEDKLDKRIEFMSGDITDVEADAVICPTLPDLDVLYTGVAGAIMRKGGDRIFAELRERKRDKTLKVPVPLYSAHITNAGNLPKTRYVIHSVAVNYSEEERLTCNPEVIFKSAWNVLEVANSFNLESVAFPALGAGLYQVPLAESIGAIAQAANRFLKEHPKTSLKQIKIVSFDPRIPRPTLVEELVLDQWARARRKSN